MRYADPNTEGSKIQFKKQYENFIGGKWIAPVKGEYFDNISPVNGEVFTRAPRSSAEDIELALNAAHAAKAQWNAGLSTGVLVVVPPPADVAVPREEIEGIIQQAVMEAEEKNIHGSKVTPFLLSRVSQLSGGNSMTVNLALLRNNARFSAKIAKAF